ncbi:MAG: hypothetical protein JNJ40_04535 [Bacteroidia bacterium]|nr:hypothetical protein [Bacteroidia bacterium]
MKKFFCILILAALSLLLSCNDVGYCNVEGNVYEEGSNIPIHNVYVRINKYSKTNSSYPFKEATTDKNGHYKIKYFKASGNSTIYIDIISGEHISLINKPVNLKNANISAYLTPYGYIRFRVKNNSAKNVTVYANMDLPGNFVPAMQSLANSDITFDHTQKVILNKYNKLQWSYYYSNSSSPITKDSVIITNKFDTLIYQIQIN